MSKQLTQAEILLAKKAYLYQNDTLFVVDSNDEAYGFNKQTKQWYHKENFWDYFESPSMMVYLIPINVQLAANLSYEWLVKGTPQEVVHNNYPFTVSFEADIEPYRFTLNSTTATIDYLDMQSQPGDDQYYSFDTDLPLLATIYFYLIDNFIKHDQVLQIVKQLPKSKTSATIRKGIAANDETLVRKGLFQALARQELATKIHYDPVGTNDPQGDILRYNRNTCNAKLNAASVKATYSLDVQLDNLSGEPLVQLKNFPLYTYAYYCELVMSQAHELSNQPTEFTHRLFADLSEKIIRQIIAEYADCKASRSKKTTALEKLLAAMLEADMIAIYEYEDFLADVLSEDLFEALFAVIEENQLLAIKVKGESNVAPEDALHFEIPRTFSMF